jgi:hypothetical protein
MTGPPSDPAAYLLIDTDEGMTVYLHQSLQDKKERMVLNVSYFLLFFTIYEETLQGINQRTKD